MRRSTARSSIAVLMPALLVLASPVLAAPESTSTSSLRVYGAYLPNRLQWDGARWGFGFATRTTLSPRWALDVGAARFTGPDHSVTPMTVGMTFGPASRTGVRPWIDAGVGYYRLESASVSMRIMPLVAYYDAERSRPTHRNNVGGYFGVGFDVALSDRIGLGTGVRIHGWSAPDGLIALQSGLSYAF